MLQPPPNVLQDWNNEYGNLLSAAGNLLAAAAVIYVGYFQIGAQKRKDDAANRQRYKIILKNLIVPLAQTSGAAKHCLAKIDEYHTSGKDLRVNEVKERDLTIYIHRAFLDLPYLSDVPDAQFGEQLIHMVMVSETINYLLEYKNLYERTNVDEIKSKCKQLMENIDSLLDMRERLLSNPALAD